MKKIISIITIFSILVFSAFSYEWPQEKIEKKSIKTFFGQKRGSLINSSLIFSDTENVQAIADGKVIITFTDSQDENAFFPSTLGTAVILEHSDNIISVYANLEKDSLNIPENKVIHEKDIIATPGNSAWKEQNDKLEFQIIDLSENSAINPKILLSKTETEFPVYISSVKFQNKNGDLYDLTNNKYFSAGTYKIYAKKNDIYAPFKTSVLVNGTATEALTYDSIKQENNNQIITGYKKYTDKEIYINPNYQLMGEATVTPGKTTIGIIISNFNGDQKIQNFNINVY